MLIGRFWMIVPALAIAGVLAGKKAVPPGPGTLPTDGPALRGPARGRHRHRGRAHVLPRAEPGPDRRALPGAGRKGVLSHEQHERSRGLRLGRARCSGRHSSTASRSSIPGSWRKNPVMFVVEVGSVLTTLIWLRDLVAPPPGAMPAWFTAQVSPLALVHRALRELRGGAGRGPGQGPGRRPARPPRRRRSPASASDEREEQVPASALRKGDVVVVEAGQLIPGDGEVIEGIASVDESAVTGRVGPGHPRERRRPLGGHRRHQGPLRPHRGAHRVEPRRVVPRPHDRPRRGGQAPEDAERDRAARAARRA